MSDNNIGIWFRAAMSGLWYEEPLAAGTISAVKIDGVVYSRPEGKAPSSEAIDGALASARAEGRLYGLEEALQVDHITGAIRERVGLVRAALERAAEGRS
jgi:hypothetical protein